MNDALLNYPFGFMNDSLFRKLNESSNIWGNPQKRKEIFQLKKQMSTLGINNESDKMKQLPKFNSIANNNSELGIDDSNANENEALTLNKVFDFKKNILNCKSKIRESDLDNKENMIIFDLLNKMKRKKRKDKVKRSKDKSKGIIYKDEITSHHLSPSRHLKQVHTLFKGQSKNASNIKKQPKCARILTKAVNRNSQINYKKRTCSIGQNYFDTKIENNITTTTNTNTNTNGNHYHHLRYNSELLFPSIHAQYNYLIQKANKNEQDSIKLLESFGKLNKDNSVRYFKSSYKKDSKLFKSKIPTSISCTNISEPNHSDKVPILFSSMSEELLDQQYQYKYIKKNIHKPAIVPVPRVNISKLQVSKYWNLDL